MSEPVRVVTTRAARLDDPMPVDVAVLAHDERHLRRKVIATEHGMALAFDLPQAMRLADRDRLILSNGGQVEVIAAREELTELRGRDARHLIELAWHLGNRHLPAQVEEDRILIARDPVIGAMLEGLGASLRDVREPFQPVHGAYHGHDHGGSGDG